MATLTAYGIAQGYTLATLVSGFVNGSVTGISRLQGAGFVVTAPNITIAGQPQIWKFATRATGQVREDALSATTLSGELYAGANQLICCQDILYAGGLQGPIPPNPGQVATLWRSTDETTYQQIQTYGPNSASTTNLLGMCMDTAANVMYSVAVTDAKLYRTNLNTLTQTLLSTRTGLTGQGLALSSGRTSLYLARRAAIDVIRVSDATVTRTIAAPNFTTEGLIYDVMPLTGAKGGKIMVRKRYATGTVTVYNGLYELDLATEALQMVVDGDADGGSLHLFDHNQIAFNEGGTMYLLTMPTGSGVSKGTCYDSTLGGDGDGNDPDPDEDEGTNWDTPPPPPEGWGGTGAAVSCGWNTPTAPVCGWTKPGGVC